MREYDYPYSREELEEIRKNMWGFKGDDSSDES